MRDRDHRVTSFRGKRRALAATKMFRASFAEPLEQRVLLTALNVSIPSSLNGVPGGIVAVPILVNQLTDGNGNTGLSQAHFAIDYDSSKLSVSGNDLHQGTAPQGIALLDSLSATFGSGQLEVSLTSPQNAIASVVGTSGNPITVTTVNPLPAGVNGFEQIRIANVTGFPAANNLFSITVPSGTTNTFTLNGTTGDIGSSNTGTWSPEIIATAAGQYGGANNPSIAVIDFHVLPGANAGNAAVSLVSSNGLGSTGMTASNGNQNSYALSLAGGSINVLTSASIPPIGSFQSVTGVSGGANPGVSTMLLLSDGSVLTEGGSNSWYRLTPDSLGNYNDGMWHAVQPSNTGRTFFGSVVMQNGDVMVLGGEYTNIGGTVTSIVGTASGPVTVTTSAALPAGLQTGTVKIAGVTGFGNGGNGNFNINTNWNFTVTGQNTFTLTGGIDPPNGTVGTGTPSSGTYGVGDSNTGEIFTPPTTDTGVGSWHNITPFPQENFGDGNLELMNDGTILASYLFNGQSYRYNPALDPLITPGLPANSNPWSADAFPNSTPNGETAWTKLPDGSIVSYQINGTVSPQTAARFVPASTPQAVDQWVPAGTVQVPLGADNAEGTTTQEIGAGILLPDGRVFDIGANGNTALYSPPTLAGNSTGIWVAGPVVPLGGAAADAPAALMVNGDVLFAVSPYIAAGVGNGFSSPTTFDEYNPATNTITPVPPNDSNGQAISSLQSDLSLQVYQSRMLVLPNHQVMFSESNGSFVYTPVGGPNAAWKPQVSKVVNNGNGNYTITGTQLNGLSEGAGYGDDAQMASNYPIVRVTDTSTGAGEYVKTYGWSTAGVATGTTPETVNFIAPANFGGHRLSLVVLANGIASDSFNVPDYYFVDSSKASSGNGLTWSGAFKTLNEALAISSFNSVIDVAAGVYSPGSGQTATFQLQDGVTIQGGFADGGSTTPEPNVNLSILNGGGVNYHVVTGSGTNSTAILEGFTIDGGNANGSSFFNTIGGGMLNDIGSPQVINCSFILDSASGGGAGIADYGTAAPYIVNCKFSFNSASDGGGIYDYDSSPNIVNCLFHDNIASNSGGGISEENSSSTIVNCTFSANSGVYGGAVALVLGSGSLFNSILWGDSSAHGELYVSSATPNVSYCDVQGGASTGTHITSSDPLFIGSNNLYELQSGSPAINAGDFAGANFIDQLAGVNTDLAGAPRFNGSKIDLGATETQIYYVDGTATGTGDGSSWDNAYTTLTAALSRLQPIESNALTIGGGYPIPAHVFVAQGTYTAGSGTNSTATFQLISDVTVEGGFAGHTNPSAARNPATYVTTLDGDAAQDHVVTGSGTDSTAVLDGFTISDGDAFGLGDANSGFGGAMLNINGSPTVSNCIFLNNVAVYSGGAVYDSHASPTFTDCVFTSNRATTTNLVGYNGIGGAVFNAASSTPHFVNCTFSGNTTTSAGGAIGDGSGSVATLTNSILWNDPAGGGGQEIYNDGPSGAAAFPTNSDIEFGSASYYGANNIFTDPSFASGSLQLLVDSPAINRGLNSAVSGITMDILGKPRVAGTTVDMGAYEYQGPFVLFVDSLASGLNNGTSWANAFTQLLPAVTIATPGFTINVAAGDYSPGTSYNSTFQLVKNETVVGGFANHGSSSPAPGTNLTYLDGKGDDSHVVTISGNITGVSLSGFVIENGNANASGYQNKYGAGIYLNQASATITNCTFSNNAAAQYGGAMEITNSANLLLTNCLFKNNSASFGGALDAEDSSTVYIFNCAFLSNTATQTGGAINITSALTSIVNCSFTTNSAGAGGAIGSANASPSIYNSILWADSATFGPEIITSGTGTLTAQNSDIADGYTGPNNLNVNPDYITSLNLQLGTGSPCINTGVNSATTFLMAVTGVTVDLAGKPRIYPTNGTVDMGAYENQGPISLFYAPGPPSSVTAGTTLPTVIVDVEQNGGLTTLEDGTSLGLEVNGVQVASAVVSGGQAKFNSLVFNTPGSYLLVAFDGTAGTAGQQFSVISQAPTYSLSFGGLPVSINAQQMLPEFGVELLKGGQIDTGDSPTIVLYLDNTNTVMGSAQVGASNLGFALFPNVQFPTTGVHFLQARDAADGIVLNSANIQVNPAVVMSTLYFGALPSNPVVNTLLSPAITVFQKDPNGNLVSDGSFVTLIVSGGTLSGASLHQQLSGGSISFAGLIPTTDNATYTVTATDGNDNTAVMVFSVYPEHLVFNYPTQTMPNFTQGSNQFLQPFTVSVVANRSVVNTDNSNITVTVLVPNTAAYIPRTMSTAGTGSATFSTAFSNGFFLGDLIETYDVVLQATDSNSNISPGQSAGFQVIPSAPTSLTVFGGGTTPAGTSVSPGFGFRESDAFLDGVYNDTTSITASISVGPAGGTLSGTLTEPVDVGFNNLIFSRAGGYTVLFTDATTGLSVSSDILITGGAPTHLVFTQEPSNTSTNSPVEPPVVVTEEDAFNDPSTLYVGSITLSVASPAGVALNGTVTTMVQNGAAVFDTVSIAQAGNNYILSAVDSNNSSLTATSTSFNVVAPIPIYVDQNAPAGGDGLSWATAYQMLQSALGVAISGDVIDVAQGDYTPGAASPITDPTSTFTLLDGVTIQGGFPTGGSNTPNPTAYPAFLDGQGTSYHVVTADGTNSLAVLEGFTITGGNANGNGDADSGFGGGLVADGGTPTITDCIFTANTAVSGGAIYIANDGASPLTISNCTFQNNTATTTAGAIYVVGSSPTILNCQFLGNSAQLGGAIENQDASSPTMANCLFAGNTANQSAGAIYNYASSPIITNCTFASNNAVTGFGGALDDELSSIPVLTNDIFWMNFQPGNIPVDISGDELYNRFPLSQPVINYSYIYLPSYILGGYTGGTGLVLGINTDAMFQNPLAGNYQLQPTSPCINVGNNAALVAGTSTDLAGNPRLVDGVVDMGAYESVLVGVTWTGAADQTNWNNPGNWSDLAVPTQSDDVTVGPGFATTIQVGGGAYAVHTLAAQSPIEIDSGGTLVLNGQSSFNGLTVDGGGTLQVVADPVVVAVAGLTIASGGTLDLTDNSMIVQGADISAITGLLKAGFNSGFWNGATGIVSAKAANDTTFLTTLGSCQSDGSLFDGVITTTNDVLVKYTYYGDANLDGVVNGADYQQIDNGFGLHKTGWANGDFNYDGVIDGSDYSLIDNAFNQLTARGLSNTPLALIATPARQITASASKAASLFSPVPIVDANEQNSVADLLDDANRHRVKTMIDRGVESRLP